MGQPIFEALLPKKTMRAIKIKFGTVDYIVEGNPQEKFGNIHSFIHSYSFNEP